MKQKEVSLLHEVLARSFIEHCDLEGFIPNSKVKFVLRFRFRIPRESYCDILQEFINLGFLEKISNREFQLNKEFLKENSDYHYNNGEVSEVSDGGYPIK